MLAHLSIDSLSQPYQNPSHNLFRSMLHLRRCSSSEAVNVAASALEISTNARDVSWTCVSSADSLFKYWMQTGGCLNIETSANSSFISLTNFYFAISDSIVVQMLCTCGEGYWAFLAAVFKCSSKDSSYLASQSIKNSKLIVSLG